MAWLNYHHLLYFWTVAKQGSIAAACRRLHLAQPTVSGQLRAFETAIGHKLFQRAGRGLALTDMGKTVFGYADEIFALGGELQDALRGQTTTKPSKLRVGVADVLPKLVVHRMLKPIFTAPRQPRVVCYEGKLNDLAQRLVAHDLDVVLGDSPLPTHAAAGAHSHWLGESSLAVFGAAHLARKFRRDFPASLDGAPFLLSTSNTVIRRTLDHWFELKCIRPEIRGEFEDSALLKVFGQLGDGLFVAPSVVEAEIRAQYDVRVVGRLAGVKEQFYAITVERRIKHPAIALLTDTARERLSAKP